MKNIYNLIGANSVDISDILISTVQLSIKCETQAS